MRCWVDIYLPISPLIYYMCKLRIIIETSYFLNSFFMKEDYIFVRYFGASLEDFDNLFILPRPFILSIIF